MCSAKVTHNTKQKKKRSTTLWIYCSNYFICFKKLEYTTHYLVVEDEYLSGFLTWVTHSSAYDPFLHVALPKRVDPRVHPLTCSSKSLTCGRLAPMRNVSVCAEKHVFAPHRDLKCIICPHLSCSGLSEVNQCLEIWF